MSDTATISLEAAVSGLVLLAGAHANDADATTRSVDATAHARPKVVFLDGDDSDFDDDDDGAASETSSFDIIETFGDGTPDQVYHIASSATTEGRVSVRPRG